MNKQPKTIMVLVFLIACVSVAGCKKSTGITGSPIVHSYPLVAGNAWEYTRQLYAFNFRPTQPGATIPLDTFYSEVRVEILGQRLLRDSILTWEFRAVETENGQSFTSFLFYRTILDSLFLYAYTSGSLIAPGPQSPAALGISFRGKTYASLQELLASLRPEFFSLFRTAPDTLYEERPPKSLVFPLRVGNEWTYRQAGYPWRMDRKVIGYEAIQITAGSYLTYRIRWFWDTDNNGEWDADMDGYDQVSREGVLRRTFEYRNLIAVSPTGQHIGYFDVREKYDAVSISINYPFP